MIDRITTREASRLAGKRPAEMLVLLRASNLKATRCGSAYLWDAGEVRDLLARLRFHPTETWGER